MARDNISETAFGDTAQQYPGPDYSLPGEPHIPEVRHIQTDRDGIHLTHAGSDTTFCGEPVGSYRVLGEPAETPRAAAKLGAWVNTRDDVCGACTERFNGLLFE